MTDTAEADCICPSGFDAAIEAAQAAAHAGDSEQDQLAAGIVAYCTYMGETKLNPLVARTLGHTPAMEIAHQHVKASTND